MCVETPHSMEESRLRAVIVLVLAVTAIAVAGATIDGGSAGGGSPGVGSGSGSGLGDGEEGGLVPLPDDPGPLDGSDWVGALLGLVFALAFVLLLALLVREVLRRNWRNLTTIAGLVALVIVLAVVTGIGFRRLSEVFSDLFGSSGNPGGLGGEGGVGIGGAESGGAIDLPLTALLALFGAAFLGAVLLAYLSRGDSADGSSAPDAPAGAALDPGSPASTATSPSVAASSHDVPADNDVYRAWLALVDAADADPSRDSPETVARRAVEAGVDERVVRDVTSLFEEVRYGGAPVTPERERRAASAVERIGGASA